MKFSYIFIYHLVYERCLVRLYVPFFNGVFLQMLRHRFFLKCINKNNLKVIFILEKLVLRSFIKVSFEKKNSYYLLLPIKNFHLNLNFHLMKT